MAGNDGLNQYIFCIIDLPHSQVFAPFAVPWEEEGEVRAVAYDGLGAVICDTTHTQHTFSLTRRSALGHQQVIERVMQAHTALPVRFGTIADSAHDIHRQVLARRYGELCALLAQMRGKQELGLKVFWKELDAVLRQVAAGSAHLRGLRGMLAAEGGQAGYFARVRAGKLVQEALAAHREKQAEPILHRLAPLAEQVRANSVRSEQMVLNAAFLLDSSCVAAFDEAVDGLGAELQDHLHFRYVGPVAPFNFCTLTITWEAPEQGLQA